MSDIDRTTYTAVTSATAAREIRLATPTLTPQELVELILDTARLQPGHLDCVAVVNISSDANLRWANNALTTNGTGWLSSVGLNAVVATPEGRAIALRWEVTDNLDRDAIIAFVESTFAEARASEAIDDLHDLVTGFTYGDWDAPALSTGPEVYAAFAPELALSFTNARRDGLVHYGYAEHSTSSAWVGASSGLRYRTDAHDGRVEMTLKSSDLTRSTWQGRHTDTFTDIDVAALDAQLRQHLAWQTNRVELPAGKYTTLLSSGAVGDMMAAFAYALSGRDAHEGLSVFSAKKGSGHHDGLAGTTRIGEQLSPLPFNIFSDPAYPGLTDDPFVANSHHTPESSLFDNGLPVAKTFWVEAGKLANLTNSRATAAEYQAPFIPDQENMIMELPGATATEEELIAGIEDGLYVTCLWYIRTLDETKLSATGLTRDGVYVIKNGKIVGATTNFRFNESTTDMLTRVTAASRTEVTQVREHAEYLSRLAMPALVVDGFNMASISDAN